jgi:uncharacterized protein YwbE
MPSARAAKDDVHVTAIVLKADKSAGASLSAGLVEPIVAMPPKPHSILSSQ